MSEIFINLTAGLEAIEKCYMGYMNPLQFIRIQSTHLEKNQLEHVLINLDYNFLMKLATGRECIVIDYTSRKRKNNTSAACYRGLAWIRYCINRIWFNRKIQLKRGMHIYFEQEFKKLKDSTRRRLKYFRKFVLVNDINLKYECKPTDHGDDYEYYQDIVNKFLK
jgi:hypothetical protein